MAFDRNKSSYNYETFLDFQGKKKEYKKGAKVDSASQ